MSKHWSDYWSKTNSVNSFAEGKQGKGYEDQIKSKWFLAADRLSNEASIVDIGTGNGGLALLLEQYSQSNNKNFKIKAIDAAKINKEAIPKSSNIEFIDNVGIEQFDFETNTIDVFVSQYGFEYAPIKETLINCLKALSKNGVMLLMIHHADSPITNSSNLGIEILKECLNESPLFMQADLLLEMARQQEVFDQGKGWQSNPNKVVVTKTIQWVMEQLKKEYKEDEALIWVEDVINRVANVLSQIGKLPAVQLKSMLSNSYRDLEYHRMRLMEQVKSVWSKGKLDEVAKLVNASGASLESEIIEINSEPYAWFVTIKKTAN